MRLPNKPEKVETDHKNRLKEDATPHVIRKNSGHLHDVILPVLNLALVD
jgi:hypothetical protein